LKAKYFPQLFQPEKISITLFLLVQAISQVFQIFLEWKMLGKFVDLILIISWIWWIFCDQNLFWKIA
jgi:hypothetical protein